MDKRCVSVSVCARMLIAYTRGSARASEHGPALRHSRGVTKRRPDGGISLGSVRMLCVCVSTFETQVSARTCFQERERKYIGTKPLKIIQKDEQQ